MEKKKREKRREEANGLLKGEREKASEGRAQDNPHSGTGVR